MTLVLSALFEERALLLGRAGRHEEALAIYIYILKDRRMAEQYVFMFTIL